MLEKIRNDAVVHGVNKLCANSVFCAKRINENEKIE